MSNNLASLQAVAERVGEESVLSHSGRRIMRRAARRFILPTWATRDTSAVSADIPTVPRYTMEALMPKEVAEEAEEANEAKAASKAVEVVEDNSWLNDVAPQPIPIHKDQSLEEHTLTCWF